MKLILGELEFEADGSMLRWGEPGQKKHCTCSVELVTSIQAMFVYKDKLMITTAGGGLYKIRHPDCDIDGFALKRCDIVEASD